MYEKFGQFIDGQWSPSENKETYEVINPATEEVLGHVLLWVDDIPAYRE